MLRLVTIALLSFALVATTGCATKFTRERFDMIHVGADERFDVQKILGDPEFRTDAEWYYEHEGKHYAARVFFDGSGRVTGKEWMDARTGEWEGKHPDAQDAPKGEVRETETRTRTIDKD